MNTSKSRGQARPGPDWDLISLILTVAFSLAVGLVGLYFTYLGLRAQPWRSIEARLESDEGRLLQRAGVPEAVIRSYEGCEDGYALDCSTLIVAHSSARDVRIFMGEIHSLKGL